MARKAAPRKTGKAAAKRAVALSEEDLELVGRLSERTGLIPREVIERALAGYAASVAPGMPLHPPPLPKKGKKGEPPAQKLFLSVDGKPEIEIDKSEFVLGSGPDVDLRLDLPLISARHARVLWREGRHVFEDLRSARGSFRLGQPVDVRFIESGDEFDLGGFLPVRFRLG
ncbi:MAG: FHA domain-containing protein [Deltaproteobacteria bacterium]|nr:MAG: FHA domain-containing protein [Deltaproteobacteria bacterium]